MAIGVLGISLSEFRGMSLSSFWYAYTAWFKARQGQEQAEWNRARFMAVLIVNQGGMRSKPLDPSEIKFPWEQKKHIHHAEPNLILRRFGSLAKFNEYCKKIDI